MLHVFDRELEYLGIMPTWLSMTWQELYQEPGKFSVTAVDTPENIRFLRHGNILWLNGKNTAMRIEYVKYAEKTIAANGFTTLSLLGQRVVIQPRNITNAEQGMYSIAAQNLRGLPDIELAAPAGYTEEFHTEVSGNLTDELTRICAETQLGVRMEFDHHRRKHIFRVYKGADRTWGNPDGNNSAVFSEEFMNLNHLEVVDDTSLFANVAYYDVTFLNSITGEKDVIKAGASVGAAEGLDRYEIYVDSDDRTKAQDELNKRLHIVTFKADVNPAEFRVRYDLGDRVTCKSARYGMTVETRIMAATETSENNKTVLTLSLGHPEYDIIKEMKLHG